MAILFAFLYTIFFIIAIVFVIKIFLNKKKNKDNGKYKIVAIISFAAFLIFFILTGVFSPNLELENAVLMTNEGMIGSGMEQSEPALEQSSEVEPEQITEDEVIEESNTSSDTTNTTTVETVETADDSDITAPLVEFIRDYVDHGKVDTIQELAQGRGLFYDKKNSGTGRYYYKVALTKDDAKVISMDDLTKGDYCVVIQSDGESLTYYNNVDLIQILYSDSDGYKILDASRLEPFEDGTFLLSVSSLDEAFEYTPSFSDEISPIEMFYSECSIGASLDEFKELANKYGLRYNYRRSNSSDGYVSYSGSEVDQTYIAFDGKEIIKDLDYYDYYVSVKYGLWINYVDDEHASKRSGNYPEAGYYIVGKDSQEYFKSAEEAIKALRAYRTK